MQEEPSGKRVRGRKIIIEIHACKALKLLNCYFSYQSSSSCTLQTVTRFSSVSSGCCAICHSSEWTHSSRVDPAKSFGLKTTSGVEEEDREGREEYGTSRVTGTTLVFAYLFAVQSEDSPPNIDKSGAISKQAKQQPAKGLGISKATKHTS